MHQTATVGAEFAQALAAKDRDRMLGLLHPEIDFRGLTPKRAWEAKDREAVISTLLGNWFEDTDKIESLVGLETDGFADRERVGWLAVGAGS